MSFKAVFVGVNEYQDPNLDNLEGSKFDAIALHALFTDSVPGLESRLLLDSQATRANFAAALSSVLDEASADDTVLVTFSGHGSAELGLALHDSQPDLPATMFALDELASLFQRTRAGRVLILLDCCQAGEGPMRVLKTWAEATGMNEAILSTDGAGRMMLAAANPQQFASESNTVAGHGLLSASLIDVLSKAKAPVDVRVLAAAVSDRVRAEAARLGEEQTPVDISIMAGGFALPPLTAGACYRAAFPERSSATVRTLSDLSVFGIPKSITDIWNREYPAGLNALQFAAINDHRLLEGENLLAIAPTGSGKTFLGELAALRAIARGRRAVFLVPLRALAAEKHEDFTARYSGEGLGLRVIRCTGDSTDKVPEFIRGKYDLAILTYEMFLGIVLANRSALLHIGAVVLDEAHTITSPDRGIAVELLLTLLVSARSRSITPQLVALSAVIGEINHFDEWLGARCLVHGERPVPLLEGVVDRSGRFQFLDVDGVEKIVSLLPAYEVQQRRAKPGAQDLMVPLARRVLSDPKETLLIFRGAKGNSSGCANYLADELGLPPSTTALAMLPTVSASSDSDKLRKCFEHGTAFHNANLIREERLAVERAFRNPGELRVLVATTTVAAGVNTPATTVVIVEHEFFNREFSVAEYKNMAGRAGRPGLATVGRSMLYAETDFERGQLFEKYVRGNPEGVRSSFDPGRLDTWLIRLLRQVSKIEPDQVVTLLANTFGGYSLIRRDPSWRGRMEIELRGRLQRMRELGLVDQHRGYLVLTRLGEMCGQSSLSLDSCMQLVEILRRRGPLSAMDVIVTLQCVTELDSVYTPLFRANSKGSDRGWPRQLIARVGAASVGELGHGATADDYEKRCKRGLMLLDWMHGARMTDIESRFTQNPFVAVTLGTVRSVADASRFHLRSAADIQQVLFEASESPAENLEEIFKRLEFGLPTEMLELGAALPILTREELLTLRGAGVVSVANLIAMADPQLDALLGHAKAKQAKTMVADRSDLVSR